ARCRRAAYEAYAHQELPFDRLVEDLRPDRDLSRNPLFQVVFHMVDRPLAPVALDGTTVTPVPLPATTSPFHLEIQLQVGRDGGLHVLAASSEDVFESELIDQLMGHYLGLIERGAESFAHRVSELPLLSPDEERLLLEEWSGDADSRWP